jgi:hypothetical protein
MKVGDSVRNRYGISDAPHNVGTVDELQSHGDVVLIKWDDGTFSQEDPTNLVPHSAKQHRPSSNTGEQERLEP